MERGRRALLVIDVQDGLLELGIFKKEELLDNINQMMDYFHARSEQVILFRHTNNSKLKQDTKEWQLNRTLHISKEDRIFNKNQSSIFKDETFVKYLQENNINSIVVTGLVTDGCIKNACEDGINLGFTVILMEDAHSTVEPWRVIADWNKKLESEGAELVKVQDYLLGHFTLT